MHKVEVSLHVNIEISEDKKVTLGNISTAIKGLGIESKIAEQINEVKVKIVISEVEIMEETRLLTLVN